MSIGIGLGAFVQGLGAGMDVRAKWDARRKVTANEKALADIDTNARAEFDRRVDAGQAEANDFESFWTDYALPMRKMELLRQGDVDGARKLAEWGDSEAAKTGGKLFSSAMLKAQTGDLSGALGDAIKAGQVKGYIEHGLELQGQTELKDDAGNVLGYRLKVKTPDGKTVDQDIAVADIPRVVATFANPDAAWQSQLEASAKQKTRDEELSDYEKKKKIDQRYSKPADYAEQYRKARESRMQNDLDFADLDEAQKDKVIRDDLAAAETYAGEKTPAGLGAGAPTGAAAPASTAPAGLGGARKGTVVVDTVTGQRVQQPESGQGGGAPAPAQTAATVSPADARQQAINDAATAMAQGGNPEYVATQLGAAGVPQEQWPDSLRKAMAAQPPLQQQEQPYQQPIGLGRR